MADRAAAGILVEVRRKKGSSLVAVRAALTRCRMPVAGRARRSAELEQRLKTQSTWTPAVAILENQATVSRRKQ